MRDAAANSVVPDDVCSVDAISVGRSFSPLTNLGVALGGGVDFGIRCQGAHILALDVATTRLGRTYDGSLIVK